jgi:hypothetical protein
MGALVVLRGAERQHMGAVRQREEADLFADQKFLDDETAAEMSAESGNGRDALGRVFRDDDALALRQSVGFQNQRMRLRAGVALRVLGIVEPPVGGGGNPVFGAEILDEPLGGFEPRARRRRAERFDPGLFQPVRETGGQRRFRADDGEIDSFLPCERHQRVQRHRIDGDAFGLPRDAGIARRAIELRHQGARAERPGQRMLASARADEKNVQGGSPLAGLPARCIIAA